MFNTALVMDIPIGALYKHLSSRRMTVPRYYELLYIHSPFDLRLESFGQPIRFQNIISA